MKSLPRSLSAVLVASLISVALSPSRAAAPNPEIEKAAQPANDGVPEVAIVRLRQLLQSAQDDEKWAAAATRLIPALIAAGQPNEALTLLEDARLKSSTSVDFWRGQAYATLRRWTDALPCFQAAARRADSPVRSAAIFSAAETLRALGRTGESLQMLNALLDDQPWSIRARLRSAELFLDRSDWTSAQRMLDGMNPTTTADRKERRFLRGRLELVRQRPERAIGTFEALAKREEGASHALLIAALYAVADAHLQLKTPESGDDFLENFIDRHPEDPDLASLFAKLDELYRAERKPARVELEKWTREPEQPRRAYAQWYRARIEQRAGHRDRALQIFGELRKGSTRTPELAAALLEYAKLTAEEGHREEAIQILQDAHACRPAEAAEDRINLLAGELHYMNGRFDDATARFEETAHSRSSFAALAKFNASLAWLQVGDRAHFLADFGELEKGEAGKDTTADLRLAEGLVQAGKGEKNATESLGRFVQEYPNDPRVSEAWVALAELAFHATPSRIDEARKDLERAAQSKPTAAADEHADYLAIWIEDATSGSEGSVIDRASRFLTQYPESRFANEVRMKLAETYYRRQDFANAQTQFEKLAEGGQTGATAEKALFFAAESAASTMGSHSIDRAIELFDRVVQMKGDLRWAARNEQAVIERKLGKGQNALLLYDEVLKGDAKPGEKREALCGKGDIYFEMGSEDPKNFDKAIENYEQLAADTNQPGHWRNQALFKKGVCLEKKADREGALTIFYNVLEEQTRPDRPPEFFWFYKAGFNAARLLEDAAKWESAATVYEKLVAAGGTRSEEAQARLSRLRLEHFLWGN